VKRFQVARPSPARSRLVVAAVAILLLITTVPRGADAASAKAIDTAADEALASLYASTPAAVELAKVAKGILVFPQVVKGGFILGAEFGNGALRRAGATTAYYNTIGASYGFQAGVESFGYALFFVTDSALEYLDKSEGWEIGVGPTLTVIDQGVAKSFSTTTLKSDIYAFFFDKQGLMAGLSLQGSKISRITPDP
jgi:lipid-binding SYLF domain-containing protein